MTTVNISHATWYTTKGLSVINRTARPTYPLNSKSHPSCGCYLRHHHRNSLPLRENPLGEDDTGHTTFLSLSPCPSSRLYLISPSLSRTLARLSLYSKYRLTLQIRARRIAKIKPHASRFTCRISCVKHVPLLILLVVTIHISSRYRTLNMILTDIYNRFLFQDRLNLYLKVPIRFCVTGL